MRAFRFITAALLPFVPLIAAVWINSFPADARVVDLRGEWQRIDPSTGAVTALRVPGRHPNTVDHRVVVRRDIELDPARLGARPVLVFGGATGVIAEPILNGRSLGTEGVPEDRYKLAAQDVALYEIPRDALVKGRNDLSVNLWPEADPLDTPGGFVDHRLLIGPADVVRPWFDASQTARRFFELGCVFYLLLTVPLILILSRLETDPVDRREQRWVAALAVSAGAYVMAKSGINVVLHIPRTIVEPAIVCIALSMVPFFQLRLYGKTNRLHVVNAILCGAELVALQVLPVNVAYAPFAPYLFVVIVGGLIAMLWDFFKAFPKRSPFLPAATLALVAAGVSDLLTDTGALSNPRMFIYAAADMAIITTLVIVARFLRTLKENIDLVGALKGALERAEESTRMKSAFLANTSHELRTPLNSIINLPDGLLEEFVHQRFAVCAACTATFEAEDDFVLKTDAACPDCGAAGLSEEKRWVFAGDAESAVRYLKLIETQGRHLLGIVNDILDVSKLEAGTMAMRFEPARVTELLHRVEAAMRPQAQQRSIDLVVALPDEVEAVIETDSGKLAQVLMNLVGNAIKFSEDGKRVDLRARVAGIGDAARLVLEVEDRGIGIAAADVSKIFESFLQLDSSNTRKFAGNGLGLPISKKLVTGLGGTIDVVSRPGVGSTFIIRLPLRRAQNITGA